MFASAPILEMQYQVKHRFVPGIGVIPGLRLQRLGKPGDFQMGPADEYLPALEGLLGEQRVRQLANLVRLPLRPDSHADRAAQRAHGQVRTYTRSVRSSSDNNVGLSERRGEKGSEPFSPLPAGT